MALCASSVVLVLSGVAVIVNVWGTTSAVSTVPTRVPFVRRVASAPSNSALHAGDLIDLRTLSVSDRLAWALAAYHRGQPIPLTVTRNGQPLAVTITAGAAQYFGVPFTSLASWPYWLAVVGSLWMLAFAALVAWHRADSSEARVLALLLLLLPLGVSLTNWRFGPPVLIALLDVAGTLCYAVSAALLATYAMLFDRPSRVRTLLAWSTYVLWALVVLQVSAWVFSWSTMALDPSGVLLSPSTVNAASAVGYLLPLLCAGFAIADTRGAERARLSWTMASLGTLYVLSAAGYLLQAVAPEQVGITYMLDNASLFIAPLGLTYALLGRKLLDVGFALNRAAIFTGVSVIVVGVFVLVEWVLGEWLQNASHAANVAVSGSLALVLGFSVRFVHGRVEHIVDNVFFRKRHENEAALRAFAHEAGYINRPDALIARTIAVIERHADASYVQLAIGDGRGRYGDVDANDPTIVALRAWSRPVDLHGLETALRGDLAFPMVARGTLVGALVLGPKRSGETYAPDESDAIMQIAHSTAASLAVLERNPAAFDNAVEDIRKQISAIASDIADLRKVSQHNGVSAARNPIASTKEQCDPKDA